MGKLGIRRIVCSQAKSFLDFSIFLVIVVLGGREASFLFNLFFFLDSSVWTFTHFRVLYPKENLDVLSGFDL